MGIADSMKKAAFSTAFSYIGKNPEENAPKLMAWVDKFAGDGPNSFPTQRAAVRKVINDKDNNMHQLVMDIMKDTDPEVLKATFMNFFLNANIIGWPKQEEIPQEVQLQHPVGDPARPDFRLQPALHRLLGGGIRQPA